MKKKESQPFIIFKEDSLDVIAAIWVMHVYYNGHYRIQPMSSTKEFPSLESYNVYVLNLVSDRNRSPMDHGQSTCRKTWKALMKNTRAPEFISYLDDLTKPTPFNESLCFKEGMISHGVLEPKVYESGKITDEVVCFFNNLADLRKVGSIMMSVDTDDSALKSLINEGELLLHAKSYS